MAGSEVYATPTPVRVPCPLGGHAPCVDDLCHGVDTTMCGLQIGGDVCPHGWLPGTCPEGLPGFGGCVDDHDPEPGRTPEYAAWLAQVEREERGDVR